MVYHEPTIIDSDDEASIAPMDVDTEDSNRIQSEPNDATMLPARPLSRGYSPPSSPETAKLASDSVDSSVETDPDNGLDFHFDISEESTQDIGPWLFEVIVAVLCGPDTIASITAYLIKREEIQARKGVKKSVRKAMRAENNLLDVFFESPPMFHPHGHVMPKYLLPLHKFFLDEDHQRFHDSGDDLKQHPASRAWILLIRDIQVDLNYRRLGIGRNMMRKMLKQVTDLATRADRPLLVAAQPKALTELSDEESVRILELINKRGISENFWCACEFESVRGTWIGYLGPWYFWGVTRLFPMKSRLEIPEDIDERQPGNATPPPVDYSHWPPIVYADPPRNLPHYDYSNFRYPPVGDRTSLDGSETPEPGDKDDVNQPKGPLLADPDDPFSSAIARMTEGLKESPAKKTKQDETPKNPFKAVAGRKPTTMKSEGASEPVVGSRFLVGSDEDEYMDGGLDFDPNEFDVKDFDSEYLESSCSSGE